MFKHSCQWCSSLSSHMNTSSCQNFRYISQTIMRNSPFEKQVETDPWKTQCTVPSSYMLALPMACESSDAKSQQVTPDDLGCQARSSWPITTSYWVLLLRRSFGSSPLLPGTNLQHVGLYRSLAPLGSNDVFVGVRVQWAQMNGHL